MVHRGIAAQPLPSQHGEEGSEEGSCQTRIEDGLDADNGTIRAFPYWEVGSGSSWDVPKLGIGDDFEEGKAHFLIIRLEVILNGDNKSGRDRGEQTGLFPSDLQDCGGCGKGAHKDQGGVQVLGVLLVKIVVMLVGCTLERLVELCAGVAGRWFGNFIPWQAERDRRKRG